VGDNAVIPIFGLGDQICWLPYCEARPDGKGSYKNTRLI